MFKKMLFVLLNVIAIQAQASSGLSFDMRSRAKKIDGSISRECCPLSLRAEKENNERLAEQLLFTGNLQRAVEVGRGIENSHEQGARGIFVSNPLVDNLQRAVKEGRATEGWSLDDIARKAEQEQLAKESVNALINSALKAHGQDA